MKYRVISKGTHDFSSDRPPGEEATEYSVLEYEVLQSKQKYYIRAWYQGKSKITLIPIEIYSGLEIYLESELLHLRDMFIEDLPDEFR